MYKQQIETILELDSETTFRGVYAMDTLPTRQMGAYVINLDNHDEPGSHWVAVYDDGHQVEYMDSYGLPPSDPRCLLFLGQKFKYNSYALQQPLSNACGFYCIYFLIHRSRGHTANDILDVLSHVDSDFVVKEFVYSRFKPVFS